MSARSKRPGSARSRQTAIPLRPVLSCAGITSSSAYPYQTERLDFISHSHPEVLCMPASAKMMTVKKTGRFSEPSGFSFFLVRFRTILSLFREYFLEMHFFSAAAFKNERLLCDAHGDMRHAMIVRPFPILPETKIFIERFGLLLCVDTHL